MTNTMLLNSEELLALVHGDAEPDRLADLLDRLERCPQSTAAFQVLVTLRAHREEALETLRLAAEQEHAMPIPHPAGVTTLPTGWAFAGAADGRIGRPGHLGRYVGAERTCDIC